MHDPGGENMVSFRKQTSFSSCVNVIKNTYDEIVTSMKTVREDITIPDTISLHE